MSQQTNNTLLVTGAGGQLGRAVIHHLQQAGAANIIAGSRTPDKLQDMAASGVDTRKVDFDEPGQLAQAFAGVHRLLIISTAELGTPGKRIAQHRAALQAAAEAGVQHVVYTSAQAVFPTPQDSVLNDHFWTEAALFAQPYTWTVLRNGLYADLILMMVDAALASGQIFSATAGRGRAYVAREDCARVAAAALLNANGRRIYEITGSAAITQNALAELLTGLYGKSIAHVDLPAPALLQGLQQAGLPLPLAQALVDFDVAAAKGYHDVVTDAVQQFTGRAPASVEDFLKAARPAVTA